MAIVRFFASILLTLGILQSPFAMFTPMADRAYTDGELNVEPDISKYVKITAVDEGHDIYNPPADSAGYRYGPSMIINADGSIDAYLSAPGIRSEWDWIMYRHSPDGGKTWTEEKAVLQPTADSVDFYSCCDPGVVKFGDYYYIGYTSTTNENGTDNCVFVARSKNPDGPFEKWNGNGWGGKPEPIVVFTGDPDTYGAGEPALVELNGTLYIYYTWKDKGINQTRLCTADATDENWPATMQDKGVAINHTYNMSSLDSADVKYVEDFGKFIAVVTCDRFTTDSFIGLYVSDDGLTFKESSAAKLNISHCCHNCGITSRPDGHIRLSDGVYLAYAYGDEWAYWPTRMNKVELKLIDAPDFSETGKENLKTPVTYAKPSWYRNFVGITSEEQVYEFKKSKISFAPEIHKVDSEREYKTNNIGVEFSGYDESIVKLIGGRFYPQNVGETYVTATWKGHSEEFLIRITE